ncbi:hypothetical protein LCGC14_1948580 [marine sediment metagenome]|uniref:Uncharacterized protein n=1 Tax=marine sediment metagenome TaxID=412755 RepID=A0A0F9IF55_9ZZZZ
MMLAGPWDYLYLWQLPLFALYVAAWLIGGPYLMRWALGRFTSLPGRKRSLADSARLNFLGGGAATIVGCLVLGCFLALGLKVGPRWLMVVGAIAAGPAMLAMGWLVHWNLVGQPAKEMAPVTVTTVGSLLLAALLIGLVGFVPARIIRNRSAKLGQCQLQLMTLRQVLLGARARGGTYRRTHPGTELSDLNTLVETRFLKSKDLICPGRPLRPVGYLFVSARPGLPGSEKITVCDRYQNHEDKRLVLFNDGRILPVSEEEFQALLALPENAAMHKLGQADR